MSRTTIAALMPSPVRLGPWGDPGWRPAGVIHYVADGPDFLWGASTSVGEPETTEYSRFVSMELREEPADIAADIAVMAFAMLGVEGWHDLERWWGGVENRSGLTSRLQKLIADHKGQYKIGIVRFTDVYEHQDRFAEIADELRQLGLEFALFDETF